MPKLIKEYKYHYFYQITNLINKHFYYGIHSTNNLNDGYMGSGKRLRQAYKKYGIENFEKKILKYFNTRKECAEYEAEIVNEELKTDPNCYNISGGGEFFNTLGLVTVKDKNGNYFDVHNQDPRYLSGELVGLTKGFGIYYDTAENKNVLLDKEIVKLNPERYYGVNKGLKLYKKKHNNK